MDTGVERPGPSRLSTPPAVEGGLTAALRSAQAGSEQGFVAVYREIQPGLVRYLRALVGQDAEDVASETWAQVCRDLATFRGDGHGLRGWIATIGRNRAIDHLRARGRRPMDPVDPTTLHDVAGGQDPATDAVDAVGTARALDLISALPAGPGRGRAPARRHGPGREDRRGRARQTPGSCAYLGLPGPESIGPTSRVGATVTHLGRVTLEKMS